MYAFATSSSRAKKSVRVCACQIPTAANSGRGRRASRGARAGARPRAAREPRPQARRRTGTRRTRARSLPRARPTSIGTTSDASAEGGERQRDQERGRRRSCPGGSGRRARGRRMRGRDRAGAAGRPPRHRARRGTRNGATASSTTGTTSGSGRAAWRPRGATPTARRRCPSARRRAGGDRRPPTSEHASPPVATPRSTRPDRGRWPARHEDEECAERPTSAAT